METTPTKNPTLIASALLLLLLQAAAVASIGVNYGTMGNNLPPPAQVAQFIKTRTSIDRVKIFDMNPDIIRAFANTNISLSVTIPNGLIPQLSDLVAARRWVESNIRPFYPATKFGYVLVGSEVLHWGDAAMVNNLVPAMRSVHHALVKAGLTGIQVTTPHSLGILASSRPPSNASFQLGWQKYYLSPMLQYHRETKSPFMVNPYPYFAWNPTDNNFALFKPNAGLLDKATGKNYTDAYDLLLDAVHVSMRRLGYGDVAIAVGETGWPSAGDAGMWWCTVENARWHNLNVARKAGSGVGTPLMPGRRFDTFLFALFNENLKTGAGDERNFGLFRPDFSAVYDIGIMRQSQPGGGGTVVPPVTPASGKQWCVAKSDATEAKLQDNINWACTTGGVDCSAIKDGGACFNPNTVKSHAAYIMNAYYQAKGHQNFNCDFSGTGSVTTSDPSYGACKYTA